MSDSPDAVDGQVEEGRAGGLGLSATPARRVPRSRARTNRDWWPNQLDLKPLRKRPAAADPMGEDFDYAAEFADPRPRRSGQGRRRGADDLAGVVAGRLRPLRAAGDPDGVALRRDVPRPRRTWRPERRYAAFRTAEQLARQPQPRQGAPAALAGEGEVRPQDLLGRPDGLRGQPRPGDDGLHDLRLRGRSGGRLGARRGQLGSRERPGSATSATAASANWRIPWRPTRWA